MRLEKVRSYPIPRYPTAVQFHEEENLTHYLPRRWRGKRLVGQVLIFTSLTGLCSCTLPQTGATEHPQTRTTTEPEQEDSWILGLFGGESRKTEQTEAQPVLEIPLFVHGNGRGSYGCESVVPPVFLSEDEAAQTIREAAREYGVDFSGTGTVDSDSLPCTNIYLGTRGTDDTYKGTLTLDGYDSTLGIGFEFVSRDDVESWHKDAGMVSTVSSFDMKGTAEKLTGAVRNTAVFYDPGLDYSQMPDWNETEDWDKAVDDYLEEQKARIREDLRAQVIDFMEWLKGQGVI